ncbi:DUF2207 domain-containing protein [Tessaracoccus antarcticus]|nr:DUF2207 domain-containing protein [Tessaracoccus antarcticus]
MRTMRMGLAVLLLAVVGMLGVASPASADQSAPITKYHIDATLTPGGDTQVTIDMVMDFSQFRGRGPTFVFPERQEDGQNPDEWFSFPISDIQVSSPSGARSDTSLERQDGNVLLRVGQEDTFYTTPQSYIVSYTVKGLIVSNQAQSGLDEFSWNAIGGGTTSRMSDVQVSINGPADVSRTACFYGTDFQEKCTNSATGSSATYTIATLDPGNPVQVVAGFPAGTFGGVQQIKTRRVTATNMFEVNAGTGATAGLLGLGAVVALVTIFRRHARDDVFVGLTPGLTPGKGDNVRIGKRSGKQNVAVAFRPPKSTRPGEIGTLVDATADTVDVSATLVDLAVRGHLRISDAGNNDHLLTRTRREADELVKYESKLLERIFKTGDEVRVSELKDASYAGLQDKAKADLYARVVSRKWFKRNPATSQLAPIALGVVILAVAGVAGFGLAQIGWGLAAIPVAVLGIGLIVMSGRFRTRTALGSAVLAETKGFELYLRTAEADQIKFEEGVDVFSRYLPYAMIFGVADRWAKVFADLGAAGRYEADLSWYYGANLYNSYIFATMLGNLTHGFNNAMAEASAAAAAANVQGASGSSSGFSGFSGGGGFGGGGGSVGSW